ncbi:hypothetical protein DQX05_27900 [Paenibacillus thiaminolyticus]|uniref:Uncharacterized protein n=1 Tax=Paenibacillus thiaminolyticus TaxID=49283 RepID=A0A3A3G981_PANTH|nr:hypothetical protein DQX05_27900 [Paenibacillus thiaminolyticus]
MEKDRLAGNKLLFGCSSLGGAVVGRQKRHDGGWGRSGISRQDGWRAFFDKLRHVSHGTFLLRGSKFMMGIRFGGRMSLYIAIALGSASMATAVSRFRLVRAYGRRKPAS